MASTKNTKSKSRGIFRDFWPFDYQTDYERRQAEFASLPPAKIVKPLNGLRARAGAAFANLQAALRIAGGDVSKPVVQEARANFTFESSLAQVGRKLADQGRGADLRRFAAPFLQ